MYETIKVFDCQQMPDNVRTVFFEQTDGPGNDCYISWWPQSPTYVEDDGSIATNDDHTIVDTWLVANGADVHEKVIIKHYW